MKTFYSIIKLTHNTLAGDSLSVGLLLHNGNRFWLQFSDERKAIAKKLLEKNSDLVDFVCKQIQQKVEEMNTNLMAQNYSLFGANNVLTSDHFTHISNYSNGVLRFSEPILLNDEITDQKFQLLFDLFIGKSQHKNKAFNENKEDVFRQKIEKSLINRVANKVHTHLDLTPEKVNGLYFNFNIDCIGLNGSFTAAKAISFHRTAETIDRELSHYNYLISILKAQYKRKDIQNDHFYLIADEPNLINSKEHKIWESISSSPIIKRIYPDEAEKVALEIEERNSSTFLV